jgi:hypothetical protein
MLMGCEWMAGRGKYTGIVELSFVVYSETNQNFSVCMSARLAGWRLPAASHRLCAFLGLALLKLLYQRDCFLFLLDLGQRACAN